MAFREHNSNILPPLYTRDKTWSAPNTSSNSSGKEHKVGVDASKENARVVPFTPNNGSIQNLYVSNNRQKYTVTKPKTVAGSQAAKGPTNALSFRASRQNALPSQNARGGNSHYNPNDSELFRMETLKSAINVAVNHSPTNDEITQSCRSLFPSPPGFTNYADAVKCNTNIKESSGKNETLYIQIFEDNGTEKKEGQLQQHPATTTIQQLGQKLHSLSENGNRRSAQEAEVILRDMISKYTTGTNELQPDGGCYNSVIHAYAEVGQPHKAEEVMRLMFTDFKNGNRSAEPNVRCLTNVLHAWRKSKHPDAPEKCEKLLVEMFELGDSNTLPNCKPDTFAITVVLHCWIESQRPDGYKHAERIFWQMKSRFNDGDESMRPDCISYSLLLNTYAQKMMIDNAENILWEMVDDFIINGNKAAEPRTRNFNTILAMHSRSPMISAPERAENVLQRYRDLCSQNLLRNKPDEYSYSLLLKAWTKSKRDDGITQALNRLNWMRDLDDDAALPDIVKYTTIISAFARNGDVGEAEALLNRMVGEYLLDKDMRVQPDVQLFDNVIKAFTTPDYVSHSDAFRAGSQLRSMWLLYEESGVNVRPQATTYKHVIIGYKKAGMPQEADDLLREMEQKQVAIPNKELIQTVMNAWHDSHRSDKQKRINDLRLFMNNRYLRRAPGIEKGYK